MPTVKYYNTTVPRTIVTDNMLPLASGTMVNLYATAYLTTAFQN